MPAPWRALLICAAYASFRLSQPHRPPEVTTREGEEVDIKGFCEPAFARVKDAFAQNFAERGEVGANVAVTYRGQTVVDLWGGLAEPKTKKALAGGHAQRRVVVDQGRCLAVRASFGRARSASPRRAGGHLLAGIRPSR